MRGCPKATPAGGANAERGRRASERHPADALADDDLHAEGAPLPAPYKVVITGSHHEYRTAPMLDAIESYLGGGGRLVYFETANGGAVFSVGSIGWRSCLSYKGYDNTVSRVTENVLRRFCADQPLP